MWNHVEMGWVDEGDNEGYDGIATVVLGVGEYDELGCSECEFCRSAAGQKRIASSVG